MAPAKYIAAALIALSLAGIGTAAIAAPGDSPGATAGEPRGRAYLFRGLIGLIDWGMDELAGRITRSGVSANIGSHLMWSSVASQAISDYRRDPKPITVIGHSIGGDSAISFAEALNAAHVPVGLLITYDPTRMAGRVPANVERYINLYQSSNFLGGGDIAAGGGFHGHYASFNLKDRPEIVHVNMDKFDRIQELLAAKIRSVIGARRGRSGAAAHRVCRHRSDRTVGLRYAGHGACRRYGAIRCLDLSCAGLGGRPDQQAVGQCNAERRPARRRAALSRGESGSERGGATENQLMV